MGTNYSAATAYKIFVKNEQIQTWHTKEETSLKDYFLVMSVRKNESKFDCLPITKQYFEI